MKARGALAFTALALASTSIANATPLLVDQQRIDRATTPPPARDDDLRGFSEDEHGASTLQAPAPTLAPQRDAEAEQLRTVHISGSSLSAEILADSWRSRVGARLNSATITSISDALTAAYQASDIALYSIVTPAQDLSTGVLGIQVIEGHVANVVIQTDVADAPDIALVRAYAERLTQETPLRRSTLERMTSLIRDIPGERIEATLAPAEEAGGTTLTLAARRNRADVGFSVSTRGTPLLGRVQGSADITLNGMVRSGDRLALAITVPLDGDAFHYAALSYSTPVGTDGATVSANVSNLHTEPEGLGIEGEATTAGVSFSYPLVRSFTRSAYASVGVDALNTENATVGQIVDTNRTRAVRAGLAYASGNAIGARSMSAFASFGIDGLGSRVNPDFAEADFTKLGLQASWSRLYAQRVALRLTTQAQWTESQLPSSEQMALGGDAYGRAFASAITQGDEGIAGSIEAAFLPPEAWLPSFFNGSEVYAFFDGGAVRTHDRALFNGYDDSLSSAGFGSRIALGRRLTLSAELARAIETPLVSDDEDWRLIYTLIGRR